MSNICVCARVSNIYVCIFMCMYLSVLLCVHVYINNKVSIKFIVAAIFPKFEKQEYNL